MPAARGGRSAKPGRGVVGSVGDGIGAPASPPNGSAGDPASSSWDVVVVGGGVSGLVSALELQRAGLRVAVVEARRAVGGRVRASDSGGHWLDLGAQWVGEPHDGLRALLAEFGLRLYDAAHGLTAVVWQGRRCTFDGDMSFGILPESVGGRPSAGPVLSASELLDVAQGWARLEAIISRLPAVALDPGAPPGRPLAAALAQLPHEDALRALDAESMSSWIARNLATPFGRFFFSAMCSSLGPIGPAAPREMSVLLFCVGQRAAPQRLGPERFLGHGGLAQLPPLLAAQLRRGGGQVLCGLRCHAVAHGPAGVALTCLGASGDASRVVELNARAAVLACAPALVAQVSFSPPLCAARQQLLQRFPMGTCLKVLARYGEPFWKREGGSGLAGGLGDCAYVETLADASDPEAAPFGGVVAAFVTADKYRRWAALPTAQLRREALLADLVALLGDERARSPHTLELADWPADALAQGGYGGFPGLGALTELGSVWAEPFGRLFFAGSELSDRWPGYVEGAIRSGRRAAIQVQTTLPLSRL